MRTAGVVSLPTRPTAPREFGGRGYSPTELKESFDRLPRLIAERYNELIEHITDGDYLSDVPFGDMTLDSFLEDTSDRLAAAEETIATLERVTLDHGESIALAADHTDRIIALEQGKAFLHAVLNGSFLTKSEVEDTYEMRCTAGGLPLVDQIETTVSEIRGATVENNGKLCNAIFRGVRSTGTNLIPFPYTSESICTINGVTFESLSDGRVKMSGVPTMVANFIMFRSSTTVNPIFIPKGTSLMHYADVPGYVGIAYWMEDGTQCASVSSINTYLSTKDAYIARIELRALKINEPLPEGTIAAPRTNSGTTILPFETYKNDDSFILPADISLAQWDYIDVAAQKLVRHTALVSFDGTEEWTEEDGCYKVGVSGLTADGICTGYTRVESDEFSDGNWCVPSSDILAIKDSTYATLDVWVAHLASLAEEGIPLSIAYRLATASEEDISIPTGYTAWKNGLEIVQRSSGSEQPCGAWCTIRQSYYTIGGEVTA